MNPQNDHLGALAAAKTAIAAKLTTVSTEDLMNSSSPAILLVHDRLKADETQGRAALVEAVTMHLAQMIEDPDRAIVSLRFMAAQLGGAAGIESELSMLGKLQKAGCIAALAHLGESLDRPSRVRPPSSPKTR